jgi:hypothetical protein
MRYTLKCAAVGFSVLMGSLAMLRPAGASQFVNLKGELPPENAQKCMGVSGGTFISPYTGVTSIEAGTQIIVWDCDGHEDQTWDREPNTAAPTWINYHPPELIRDVVYGELLEPLCLATWYPGATGLAAGYCGYYDDPGPGGASADIYYDYNYVQDDPAGYPCFTIQEHDSGLYVGVLNSENSQILNGMLVGLSNATSDYDQVWCDHAPSGQILGTATPDMVVLTVIYSPPGKGSSGKGSTMSYQSTTSVGTTLTTTSDDQNKISFSAGATFSGASVEVDTSRTSDTSNTDSTDVTMSWMNTTPIIGMADAIDHDYDAIYFIMKPLLNGTYTPLYPTISGQAGSGEAPDPGNVNWTFAAGDQTNTDVTTYVLAGWLNGDIPWDPAVLPALAQYGLHPDTDVALNHALLWADPLFNADGINGVAPIAGYDSARFQNLPVGQLTFDESTPTGTGWKLDQKTTNSMTTKSTYTYNVTVKASDTFSFLKFSASSSWTWSHSSSTENTMIQEQADMFSLVPAQAPYTGPIYLHAYEDMMFKTYAFTLDEGPSPSSFYDYGATQCAVGAVSAHCCPSGSVMVGARVDQNVFDCAPVAHASAPIVADCGGSIIAGCANTIPTERTFPNSPSGSPVTIHSCPPGSVMVGLRADLNILLCQQMPTKSTGYTWNAITTERVDDNASDTQTPDGYMHACEPAVYSQAMSGINVATNTFNCAINPGFAN